jgi:hypothetical protein
MRALAFGSLIAFFAAGCLGQDEEFVGDTGFYAFAMTEATPAFATGDETSVFLVEMRVEFPIVAPTDEEMADLMLQAPAPYARMPWVEVGDLAMEMDVTVKNLMPEAREVTVTINGFNEFDEYVPIVEVIDDEPVPQYSQWERTTRIDANETFEWTVDERELDEVAVDLATVVNGAPNPQQVVHFESQSGLDPRTDPYIPAVVPGVTGFRFGLMATAASNLVFEASIRIRDVGDKLHTDEDEDPWVLPVPTPFTPAIVMEP